MAGNSNLSKGAKIFQAKQAARTGLFNPFGATWFVDSANGTNSSANGKTADNPCATVAYVLANLAQAGDQIIVSPGGSETVTATIAMNLARISIICPVANAEDGYAFGAAGTVDIMTISAAGCTVRGCKFAHTGSSCTKAGILTTAGADKMTVENCLFDDSAITTTFQGQGINLVDDTNSVIIRNNVFKDCLQGIKFTIATGAVCADPTINGNVFFVGQAVAFGMQSALTGTGIVRGLKADRNIFIEAKGSGAAAVTAWDGTSGANATVGPFKFEAAVDQWVVSNSICFTAATETFNNLAYVTSGSVGSLVGNRTQTGGDLEDFLTAGTADASTNTYMRDVVGNKTDAAVETTTTTKSLMAYAKGALDLQLVPSADATANAVASDVLGNKTDASVYVPGTTKSSVAYAKGTADLQERVAKKTAAVISNGLTLFTIAGGPIQIISLESVCETANDGTASTLQYNVTPTVGSAQTISAASASLANAAAGASVALQGTALSTAALYNANGPNLIANPGTIFAPIGTITAVVGVGSTTGTWAHYLRYKPLATGVTVS